MPELPEVENVRSFIAPVITDATISSAEVLHPRMDRRSVRSGQTAKRLAGQGVVEVERHGKFLLIRLSNQMTWVIHLGMSGRIQISDPGQTPDPHLRFRASLAGAESELWLIDIRTFGFVSVYTPAEITDSPLSRLGPDALNHLPSTQEFAKMLANRTAVIKTLLLNQNLLAGLGNIYTDEILFRAGVAPLRSGGDLDRREIAQLRSSIRPVLTAGIKAGGTSLADLAYLLPDGRTGRFLEKLKVYGRTGQNCFRCGEGITRTVISNRSAHWCPNCQPLHSSQ